MREIFEGKLSDLTEKIIRAFFQVYNPLGYVFSEKIYENAMVKTLKKSGYIVDQQRPISVYFEGEVIGEYFVDLLVNGLVIIELKACGHLLLEHEAQLLNYLKATQIEVGLLLNFGPKPKFVRKVYDNDHKGLLTWTQP